MKAYVGIRTEPHYRRDAFIAGLSAAGYEIAPGPAQGRPGDLYVIWNRYSEWHNQACRFEAAGGTVIVAENGYVGKGGVSPHSMKDRDPYALARSYHNDATVIPEGGPERWDALGVDLKPWRTGGQHVLVCPNRSFGIPGRMMPSDWANDVVRRLAKLTQREIRVRPHPGNSAPKKPLADDLAGAWCTVIWSSSAGVHSLIAGVPVICEAPYWIAKGAAGINIAQIESPPMPDRLPALRRLAWAQWSLAEITAGAPFARPAKAA